MRRSTLQRKDRSELNQIATALGARPSSRARKDEIIQLILDLTSTDTQPDHASTPQVATATATAASARAAGDSHLDGTRTASRHDGEASGSGTSTGRDNSGGASTRNVRRSAGPGATARDAGGGAATSRPGQDEETPGNGDGDGNGQAGGPGGDRLGRSGAEQNPGDRGEDDVDPANRRRRRRGRDRDRDREDSWDGDPVEVTGWLDLRDEGYGFLRVNGCLPDRNDAYVPVKMIRQYGVRRGDRLSGTSRPANRTEKNPALLTLDSINGAPAADASGRPIFDHLTPIHAVRRLTLEQPENPDALPGRLIDLVAPIGVGQRVLVRGPRRSGASELLASISAAIEANEPDIHVMGLFLDQRPEDITEMRRVIRNGEVAATSFEQAPEDHVQTAEMTVERAKRLVEAGRDVAVVLDGITALAKSYNASLSNAGRAFSGNVESGAVHMPKKLFGAGRNTSEAGSLTMVASIASEGPGPVQAAVCEEFAGAANTEICLDRWAAERGVFPAIDVRASLSHDEHRFLDDDEVQALRALRRGWLEAAGDGPAAVVRALEAALSRLGDTAANAELLG